jgi:hypothetical protein
MGGDSKSSDNPAQRLPDWRVTLPLAQACPRCGARTRSGPPCKGPAVRNSHRCRMHGGTSPGAPPGPKHGMYRHGRRSAEVIERRRLALAEARELRKMVRVLTAEARRDLS